MEKFSVYPTGAQGVALLALRVSLASTLFSHALLSGAAVLPAFALLGLAFALLIGGIVRIAATCAAAFAIARLTAPDLSTLGSCLDAVAVAILGAGAYSLDARLFGRRIIRIDHRKPPSLPNPHG